MKGMVFGGLVLLGLTGCSGEELFAVLRGTRSPTILDTCTYEASSGMTCLVDEGAPLTFTDCAEHGGRLLLCTNSEDDPSIKSVACVVDNRPGPYGCRVHEL